MVYNYYWDFPSRPMSVERWAMKRIQDNIRDSVMKTKDLDIIVNGEKLDVEEFSINMSDGCVNVEYKEKTDWEALFNNFPTTFVKRFKKALGKYVIDEYDFHKGKFLFHLANEDVHFNITYLEDILSDGDVMVHAFELGDGWYYLLDFGESS